MIRLQDIKPRTTVYMAAVEDGEVQLDVCHSEVLSATETSIEILDVELGEDFIYELRDDGLLHNADVSCINPWVIFFEVPEGGSIYTYGP